MAEPAIEKPEPKYLRDFDVKEGDLVLIAKKSVDWYRCDLAVFREYEPAEEVTDGVEHFFGKPHISMEKPVRFEDLVIPIIDKAYYPEHVDLEPSSFHKTDARGSKIQLKGDYIKVGDLADIANGFDELQELWKDDYWQIYAHLLRMQQLKPPEDLLKT